MHFDQEGIAPLNAVALKGASGDLAKTHPAQTNAPRTLTRGYTIGITIFINADGDFGLFENGLRQNVVFLYHLFKAAPHCRRVYLLNHGDGEPKDLPPNLDIDPADIVRTPAIDEPLDFVLFIGAAMDRDTALTLRTQGTRFIAYKGGNGAVISMEAMIARPPRGDAERYFDVDLIDTIWMTPQHLHSYAGWCRTLYRCAVEEVPQIWSPRFILSRKPEIQEAFGYRAAGTPWRVGVLDPNITVMKTSHVPMLACEAAFRVCPAAFAACYISNGWPHRDNAHFASFTLALKAVRAGVMTLEPRFVSADFLANHCDAVVTHQWENGLNYLYYEVLYGGYPLIHNSPFLKDYGYYYEDFDALGGAAALLYAYQSHDGSLDAYRNANQRLFDALAPTSAAVIAHHENLLEKLVQAD